MLRLSGLNNSTEAQHLPIGPSVITKRLHWTSFSDLVLDRANSHDSSCLYASCLEVYNRRVLFDNGSSTMTMTTLLPLEDGYTDIINKAMRGLKLQRDEILDRASITAADWDALLNETVLDAPLKRVAFVLGLDPERLLALAKHQWQPKPLPAMDGLIMTTTDYGDMTVNATLVWDPITKMAATFDTGSTCQPLLDAIDQHQLTLARIFITHTHMDHQADLIRLRKEALARYPQAQCYGSAVDNPLGLKPLSHGVGLALGNLFIRVLGTSGHTPGGLSYYVTGLERPVVIVGDALFASSMGGAPTAYHEALENNRTKLLTLPNNTIICPGHGPSTTVGEEREHNPFFPN